MGLTTLNIDDDFIKNLKDADVSLDLKNADAEGRSKAAVAMQAAMKSYQSRLAQEIEQRKNIVIDGTAASYKKTEQFKEQFRICWIRGIYGLRIFFIREITT
jgi:ribosomal protein L20